MTGFRLVKLGVFRYRSQMTVSPRFALSLSCFCALLGCLQDETAPSADETDRQFVVTLPPYDTLPNRPELCARENSDVVHAAFCAEAPPDIRSLADVQNALAIVTAEDDDTAMPSAVATVAGYGNVGRGYAVLQSHSTALAGDVVSPINPRAIIYNAELLLAFNRGIQQVELIAQDRVDYRKLNFYLISFEQACNTAAEGCTSGDLYTASIESDWTRVAIQDDEQLKNTPSDCRQCHQRGRDRPQLLMRELDGPWTHFFGADQDHALPFDEPTGTDLMRDYLAAKGDEPYAGIPTRIIRQTVGFTLQNVVLSDQPLLFDGSKILNERWPWNEAGYAPEPAKSITWYTAYEAFKRGDQLALPYFAPRVTDAAKQATLTAAYQSYLRQEISAADLPDFADIFPDDPQTRAEIGLQTEPGATPAQMLVQACGTCHNDALDQTLSRARFNIAIGRLPRAELDLAIARLKAPKHSPSAMPPHGRRQLDGASRAQLIAYLTKNARTSEDDALLEHAAQRGMVSSAQPYGSTTSH